MRAVSSSALNHSAVWFCSLLLCCAFRFLGHLYAAEALISLDRISDAIAHLNPENVSDVSMGVLTSEQDQGLWALHITLQNI